SVRSLDYLLAIVEGSRHSTIDWRILIQQGRVMFSHKKAKVWVISGAAVCWTMWRARNDVVFNQHVTGTIVIFDRAQLWAFDWLHVRGKQTELSLQQWQANPRSAFHRYRSHYQHDVGLRSQ
ncbi:hypothetical protein Ancab_026161, partial [Ancistrocladus abbreviatus]